jgi:outer membrane protein OmpA-like peptidoglycan-associated protein
MPWPKKCSARENHDEQLVPEPCRLCNRADSRRGGKRHTRRLRDRTGHPRLTRLQSDAELATRAPVALKEAEAAVVAAEQPLTAEDATLGAHRVYMADRKVEIAMAQATTGQAEDERVKLAKARERSRLDARTREADAAHAEADATRVAAADAATAAAQKSEDMQHQIDALQATATERGIVLTLGDVMFTTGRADLKAGTVSNLDRLVGFLNENPGRKIEIEGHTDNVGSEDSNLGLSQRRADSVKSYLVQQGIEAGRIVSSGKGEHQPVADNESEGGRQRNRRVEVIIDHPSPAVGSP